ncbi:hypothetical protein MZH72_27270, partial [Escherichia coli]|nr:hypothetical protein [Escherichia coli]
MSLAEGQKPLQNRKISYVRKNMGGLELGQEEGTLHKLAGTVAKLAMRQPFVLFKGLTFQKLC